MHITLPVYFPAAGRSKSSRELLARISADSTLTRKIPPCESDFACVKPEGWTTTGTLVPTPTSANLPKAGGSAFVVGSRPVLGKGLLSNHYSWHPPTCPAFLRTSQRTASQVDLRDRSFCGPEVGWLAVRWLVRRKAGQVGGCHEYIPVLILDSHFKSCTMLRWRLKRHSLALPLYKHGQHVPRPSLRAPGELRIELLLSSADRDLRDALICHRGRLGLASASNPAGKRGVESFRW
jgi:hypothetical protein